MHIDNFFVFINFVSIFGEEQSMFYLCFWIKQLKSFTLMKKQSNSLNSTIQEKIKKVEERLKQCCLSVGESLSYCNLFLQSLNTNQYPSKEQQYRVKSYIIADQINLLKKSQSFSQNMSTILSERQTLIRQLRSELILKGASKQLSLSLCLQKLEGVRGYTMMVVQNLTNLMKRLKINKSSYISDIVNKLSQDLQFLKFTSLKKHIRFSTMRDPLFYQVIALNDGIQKKYKSLRNFVSPCSQYRKQLKLAHQFLMDNSQQSSSDKHKMRIKAYSRNDEGPTLSHERYDTPKDSQFNRTKHKISLPSLSLTKQKKQQDKSGSFLSKIVDQIVDNSIKSNKDNRKVYYRLPRKTYTQTDTYEEESFSKSPYKKLYANDSGMQEQFSEISQQDSHNFQKESERLDYRLPTSQYKISQFDSVREVNLTPISQKQIEQQIKEQSEFEEMYEKQDRSIHSYGQPEKDVEVSLKIKKKERRWRNKDKNLVEQQRKRQTIYHQVKQVKQQIGSIRRQKINYNLSKYNKNSQGTDQILNNKIKTIEALSRNQERKMMVEGARRSQSINNNKSEYQKGYPNKTFKDPMDHLNELRMRKEDISQNLKKLHRSQKRRPINYTTEPIQKHQPRMLQNNDLTEARLQQKIIKIVSTWQKESEASRVKVKKVEEGNQTDFIIQSNPLKSIKEANQTSKQPSFDQKDSSLPVQTNQVPNNYEQYKTADMAQVPKEESINKNYNQSQQRYNELQQNRINQKVNQPQQKILKRSLQFQAFEMQELPSNSRNNQYGQFYQNQFQTQSERANQKLESTLAKHPNQNNKKQDDPIPKCIFQSKSLEQSQLMTRLRDFNKQSFKNIEPYLTTNYFKNRHILMTTVIINNEPACYCLYYIYLTRQTRFLFILHIQISRKYAHSQTTLINTFIKYLFCNDPADRIIYLKHKQLFEQTFIESFQSQKNYIGEVKTPIKTPQLSQKSYLFQRKDIVCSKQQLVSSLASCYLILATQSKELNITTPKTEDIFFSSSFLNKIQNSLKKRQTKKFLDYSQLQSYLQQQKLPTFKKFNYNNDIVLFTDLFQDSFMRARYYIHSKYFYFTVQPPYIFLFESEDVYYLMIATSVEKRYLIIADKIYEDRDQTDIYKDFRQKVMNKKLGELFGDQMKRGAVVACPMFKREEEISFSTQARGIITLSLEWKDYIKGSRYFREEEVEIEFVGPFFCGMVQLDEQNSIKHIYSAMIGQEHLLH